MRFGKNLRFLILPGISGYVNAYKGKDKSNKLFFHMSFHIDNEKLLEKYETISTTTGDLKKYCIKCITSL